MSEDEHGYRIHRSIFLGSTVPGSRVFGHFKFSMSFSTLYFNSGFIGAQNIPHTKYVEQLKAGALSVSQLLTWSKRLHFSWALCFASLELAFGQYLKPKSDLIQTLGKMDLAPSPVFQGHL